MTTDLGMPQGHGLEGVPTADQPQTRKDFSSDQEVRWCPGCGDYAILAAVQGFMVLSPLGARLLELMPYKAPPDLSKFLMSPMPETKTMRSFGMPNSGMKRCIEARIE